MKICVIGDPHGDLDEIKKIPLSGVNLILLTGDLGSADLMTKLYFENIEREKKGLAEKEYSASCEKRAFMEAYNSTMNIVKYLSKFAPVCTIFGNVESSNYGTRRLSRRIGVTLPCLSNDLNAISNVRVINNRVAVFGEIRVGGLEYFVDTNWVREFRPTDFRDCMANAKKETLKAKRVLRWFGSLDILVCHQPPYGVLDKVSAKFAPKQWQGKQAGSKAILDYVVRKQPRYVFCGHIHEGKGMEKVGDTEVYNLGNVGYKIVDVS